MDAPVQGASGANGAARRRHPWRAARHIIGAPRRCPPPAPEPSPSPRGASRRVRPLCAAPAVAPAFSAGRKPPG